MKKLLFVTLFAVCVSGFAQDSVPQPPSQQSMFAECLVQEKLSIYYHDLSDRQADQIKKLQAEIKKLQAEIEKLKAPPTP